MHTYKVYRYSTNLLTLKISWMNVHAEHISLIKIIHRCRFQENPTTYMTWRFLNLYNMPKCSFQQLKLQIRMTRKMALSLTGITYEKLKSVFDHERTSASYKKPVLPALSLTFCKIRECNRITWWIGCT